MTLVERLSGIFSVPFTGLPPSLQVVAVASEEFVGVDMEGETFVGEASLFVIRSCFSEISVAV